MKGAGSSTPCSCSTSAAQQQLTGRRAWYDSLYARMMARQAPTYNRLLAPRKQQLLAHVVDDPGVKRVLEVGMGPGSNLPFYARQRKDLQITAVDPNPAMVPFLHAACEEQGFPLDQLAWLQGVAEELPLPDGSQDVVIASLVLCSVLDQRTAVSEIKRVLRPGGSFLFLEHVAAPLGSWGRSVQELVNPAWRRIADGCCVNRETWGVIRGGGWSDVQITHFEALSNPLFGLLAPHIIGRAVK